jgi:hypothetical protein
VGRERERDNAHVIVPNLPFADPGAGQLSVAWSADSRRIRYGDQALRIDGARAPCCHGSWQRTEREHQGYDESVISPDGRWIASTKQGRIARRRRSEVHEAGDERERLAVGRPGEIEADLVYADGSRIHLVSSGRLFC